MIIRRLTTVPGLLHVLAEETVEMQELRLLFTAQGKFPSRRTWERRWRAMPATLPAHIACLSQHVVHIIQPWQSNGCAVAIDSTALRAGGGVWHQKHREAGVVPYTSIDTEAPWSKSGWYGWKLHVACTVGEGWIPRAAQGTTANVAAGETAGALVQSLPQEVRFVGGDTH